MVIKKFNELKKNHTKKQIVWMIVKGDLSINSPNKNKNLTKKQYESILKMEG